MIRPLVHARARRARSLIHPLHQRQQPMALERQIEVCEHQSLQG
jgi:hypothetical protein